MSKARITRLQGLEQKVPTSAAATPSPFPAIAAFVDENGGRQAGESYFEALARIQGQSCADLRRDLTSRADRASQQTPKLQKGVFLHG
ncbi:hypothetical protein HNR26_003803 [Rhizobium rosettiformans]|uniref:Uncharacterized protein n=1 Tax=Rhizobium rosettiformans TaxID=1368430 RepID=A0A7W8MEC2_9HYPH|nr:hypothetical protein [Rhizobium rosettiformans]